MPRVVAMPISIDEKVREICRLIARQGDGENFLTENEKLEMVFWMGEIGALAKFAVALRESYVPSPLGAEQVAAIRREMSELLGKEGEREP